MTRTVEGARIFLGPSGDPEGWLRCFVGTTDGSSRTVLDRCKELLVGVTHWVPPDGEPPTLDEWKAFLPNWFLEACASEMSTAEREDLLRMWRELDAAGRARFESEQAWTFADWIAWFDWSSDLRRSWRWWNGGVANDDAFWIEVEVDEDPAALGTLTWMMRAAGAKYVIEQSAQPRA